MSINEECATGLEFPTAIQSRGYCCYQPSHSQAWRRGGGGSGNAGEHPNSCTGHPARRQGIQLDGLFLFLPRTHAFPPIELVPLLVRRHTFTASSSTMFPSFVDPQNGPTPPLLLLSPKNRGRRTRWCLSSRLSRNWSLREQNSFWNWYPNRL